MRSRWLVLLMVLMLVGSFLVGCSSSKDKKEQTSAPSIYCWVGISSLMSL